MYKNSLIWDLLMTLTEIDEWPTAKPFRKFRNVKIIGAILYAKRKQIIELIFLNRSLNSL